MKIKLNENEKINILKKYYINEAVTMDCSPCKQAGFNDCGALVKEIQKTLGVGIDAIIGDKTTKAIINKLKTSPPKPKLKDDF